MKIILFVFYMHGSDLLISVEIACLLLIIILSSDLGYVIPRYFRHSKGIGYKSRTKFEKILMINAFVKTINEMTLLSLSNR